MMMMTTHGDRPRGSRNNVAAARDLRQRLSSAEHMLWSALRDRRLDGLKFRRQHPVGPYVLDFCCADVRLAVELDGAIHDRQIEDDEARTSVLTASGYHVVRFRNSEVISDLGAVLGAIRRAVADRVTGDTMTATAAGESLPSPAHRERGWG